MWFADIVLDLPWMSARQHLGEPVSRTTGVWGDPPIRVDSLLYAEGGKLRHVRKLFHVATHEECDLCTSQHLPEWISSIEIASSLATGHTASPVFIPNSTNYILLVGEGDESSGTVQLTIDQMRQHQPNWDAAAQLIEGWQPGTRAHLHFLSSFMHTGYPLQTRWLNGYRFLEWHFRRGRVGLAKDRLWQAFLDQHGTGLDRWLVANQPRSGLLEEVRASVAHAMLAHRRGQDREDAMLDMAAKTFPILEGLCSVIMTEIAVEGVAFAPVEQE